MKIKRWLSMLLAVSMIVSVLAVTGAPVLAEGEHDPNWIGHVAILGTEQPQLTSTPAELYAQQITGVAGAGYTVISFEWSKYEYNPVDQIGSWCRLDENDQGPIGAGIYMLRLNVTAEGNRHFDYETTHEVNDATATYKDNSDTWMEITVNYAVNDPANDYNHLPINTVSITGLPSKETLAGQSAQSILPAVTADPANSVSISWMWEYKNEQTDEWEPFNGTFEDKKMYRLVIQPYNAAGYYFDAGTQLQMDGNGDVSADLRAYAAGHISAEYSLKTQIHTVELSGYTEPVIDAAPDLDIQLPTDAPYSFQSWDAEPYAIWWRDNYGNINPTAFLAYTEAAFYGRLKAADGYEFAEQVTVVLNGQTVSNEQMSADVMDDNWLFLEAHYQLEPEIVSEVVLNNVPTAEKGKAAPALTGITLPEEAKYSLAVAKWQVYDYASRSFTDIQPGQTLAEGKQYRLQLTLQADGGCMFQWSPVVVNGKYHDNYMISNNGASMDIYVEYQFTTELDSVHVVGLSGLTVGSKIPSEIKAEVENANYEIAGVTWWSEKDYELLDAETTLKDGESYQVEIMVTPKEGYHFCHWYELDATVDGQVPVSVMGDANLIMLIARVSTRKVIDTISITGITEPVLGAKPTTEGIAVAETDKYQVTADWWDRYWEEPGQDAVFEDGQYYTLRLYATPKDGYEFAENAKILVNGKEHQLNDRSDYQDSMEASLELHYSFCDVIDKVELTAADAKIGEDIIETLVEKDAYYAQIGWQYYEDGDWLRATGKFESGKVYRREINASPKEGYEFQQGKTVVTVNGESVMPEMTEYDTLIVLKKFHLGLETIDKIELTGVTLPVIGAKPTVEGITLPKDAEYKALDIFWMVSDTGDLEDNKWEEAESFQEGKYYALTINAEVTGDKVFGSDVKFLINGKEQGEVTVHDDVATCEAVAVFHLVKEEEQETTVPTTEPTTEPTTAPTTEATAPNETTKPTATNPNTAEQSILMPFVLLLMLSAAGLMVTAELKKRMAK